jgi:hypothetical protein
MKVGSTHRSRKFNLASRLYDLADVAQILADATVAEGSFLLVPLGEQTIKGYDHGLGVFAVAHRDIPAATFDA